MLNRILTALDNDPTAPGDWVWPSFTAYQYPSLVETARATLIGTGPRELRVRAALQLERLHAGSTLFGPVAPLAYTDQDVWNRLGRYGITVSITGSTQQASVQVLPGVPLAWSVQVQAVDASTVGIYEPGAPYRTAAVTFQSGLSSPVTLLASGLASVVFSGSAIVTGTQWSIRAVSPAHQAVLAGIQTLPRLDVSWLGQDLASQYLQMPSPLDRLSILVEGIQRARV